MPQGLGVVQRGFLAMSLSCSPALAEGVHQDGAVGGARQHQVQLRTDRQASHLQSKLCVEIEMII